MVSPISPNPASTTPTAGNLGNAQVNGGQIQMSLLEQGVTALPGLSSAALAVNGPVVYPANANTGDAIITATVTDLTSVPPTQYQLTYNNGQWQAKDLLTAQPQPAQQSGSTLSMPSIGLKMQVSGTPAAGDQFTIAPRKLSVVI